MKIAQFVGIYAVSPLGAAVLAVSAAAAATAGFAVSPAAGAIVLPAVWLALSLGLFAAGISGPAVIRERDRRLRQRELELLGIAAERARRIGRMRLPDPEMKQLADQVSLHAGEYYARSLKHNSYDPGAHHAIEECLEILDAWLMEQDAQAGRQRYGGSGPGSGSGAGYDTGVGPGGDLGTSAGSAAASIDERTRALLKDRMEIISRAACDAAGGLTPADKISVKEELDV
ncbi:MAG: hypothetical protein ACOC0D_06305 [Spirochaeta sp.]